MPSFLIIIACVVGVVFLVIAIVKYVIFTKGLIREFDRSNVIVYGKIGRGKGLTTQYVINHRKKPFYSNIPYVEEGNPKQITILDNLKEVSCGENDYKHIVEGNIKKTPHKFVESSDIFIDDIGVYLPSYMDSLLYKYYPSMPILYAMSRQLYDMHIHCNTQSLERGWKALREQADFYVKAVCTYKLFGFIFITKLITYDKYESAKANLCPIKTSLFNKYAKAEKELYIAQNGEIKSGYIIQFKKDLHYDTRYFENVLLEGERLHIK